MQVRLWVGVGVAAVAAVVAATGAFAVSGGTITTIAGTGEGGYSGDGGLATRAQLDSPHGVAVDGQGNVYVADYRNHRVRKVSRGGIITTFATVPSYLSKQGGYVRGVAVDVQRNVYVSEEFGAVYKVSANAKTVTRIAGTDRSGFSGDGGPATSAQLGSLEGVAVDGQGNVYIADESNHRVRKVSRGGTITTLAGTGGDQFSGDGGPATSAQLAAPSGIAVDRHGNVYIGDESDGRVRKVSPRGTITTFAGGGRASPGDGGRATKAKLGNITGVAVDRQGNVYFSDWSNGRVRKVSPSGTITTVAGGGRASAGTNGLATSVWLSYPDGVAVNGKGNLYIAEGDRVRKVRP